MAKLQIQNHIVPLELEIGDMTVKGHMNLSPVRMAAIGAKAKEVAERQKGIDTAKEKASEEEDLEAYMDYERQTAENIAPLIKAALGTKFYDGVLIACGQGEPVEPEACNEVMYKIMWAIADEIGNRNPKAKDEYTDKMAAHYLAEVPNALQSPDAD